MPSRTSIPPPRQRRSSPPCRCWAVIATRGQNKQGSRKLFLSVTSCLVRKPSTGKIRCPNKKRCADGRVRGLTMRLSRRGFRLLACCVSYAVVVDPPQVNLYLNFSYSFKPTHALNRSPPRPYIQTRDVATFRLLHHVSLLVYRNR